MPTLVDALVMEISLDASPYEESEKRATTQWRDLIRRVQVSATKSEGVVGAGTVAFFSFLDHPIAALRSHFEGLTAHAQRISSTAPAAPTQQMIAPAANGARGLEVLGIAGLSALTSLTLLNRAMEMAGDVAERVFTTAVTAAAAGMDVTEFKAITQALLRYNVPEADSGTWLAGLRQAQLNQKLFGQNADLVKWHERLWTAGFFDIDVFSDSPEQIAIKLARDLNRKSADEARTVGAGLDMSPTLTQGLRGAGRGLPGNIAAERSRATKPEDVAATNALLNARNELTLAYARLSRTVWTALTPALVDFTEATAHLLWFFTKWLRSPAQELGMEAGQIAGGAAVRRYGGGGSSGPPGGGPAPGLPPVGGGDEAEIRDTIRQAAIANGITDPEQIRMAQAAFLSAFAFESNLRHDIVRPGGTDTGWAQWVGPRLRHMEEYGDPRSLEANKKQLYYELTGEYRKFLIGAARAQTPTEAALFAHYFESGGAAQFEGAAKAGHIALAQQFYDKPPTPTPQSVDTPTGRDSSYRLINGFLVQPGTKFNSQGNPYNLTAQNASETAIRNNAISSAYIKAQTAAGKPWYNPADIGPILNFPDANQVVTDRAAAQRPAPPTVRHVTLPNITVHTAATTAAGIAAAAHSVLAGAAAVGAR